MRKTVRWIAGLLVGSGAFLPWAARGAPPGWVLRNGSWVPVIQPDPSTPEGRVAGMIRELDSDHTGDLISDAKKWLKENKKHPLVPQVLLLEGDAERKRGNKFRALFSYEDLLNNFPTSDLYAATLEREFDIANAFMKGYKRKFLGFRIVPEASDGIELLDRLQDRARGSALAERAGIAVADYYYSEGTFLEAVDSYGDFLKRYPYSQYARKAEVRRAQSSLATFRGVLFDVTPLLDGRERLAGISQAYPQTAEQLQASAIDDRIYQLEGQKELEVARYYWRANKRHAAAYYYKRVLSNWPDTIWAQQAEKELSRRLPGEIAK